MFIPTKYRLFIFLRIYLYLKKYFFTFNKFFYLMHIFDYVYISLFNIKVYSMILMILICNILSIRKNMQRLLFSDFKIERNHVRYKAR